MGYTPAESHEHADSLGDAFDDETRHGAAAGINRKVADRVSAP